MSAQPKPVGVNDPDVVIHHGDALEQLRLLPSESVQCIITSPPFWGLRDYGTGTWIPASNTPRVIALTEACDHLGNVIRTRDRINENCGTGRDVKNKETRAPMLSVCTKCGAVRTDQQIGLEETPDEWCDRLVAVFRECRRVLRNDGVFWLEIGDTYAGSSMNGGVGSGTIAGTQNSTYAAHDGARPLAPGTKPKDLVGAPWLLAFALRADGWFLRSENIWARPNPMPESVTDRPTTAHSTVFLLTKRGRYYYDADAIREPNPDLSDPRRSGNRDTFYSERAGSAIHLGVNAAGANARSVWSIPTEPTPFAHFATFPQSLVEKCLKAGTSERGACSACGTPWRRIAETRIDESRPPARRNIIPPQVTQNGDGTNAIGSSTWGHWTRRETTGWEPSCACNASIRPCVCLDPFMGSGTVGIVARRLGRHAVGVELNSEYIAIAARRLQQLSLLA